VGAKQIYRRCQRMVAYLWQVVDSVRKAVNWQTEIERRRSCDDSLEPSSSLTDRVRLTERVYIAENIIVIQLLSSAE